MNPMSMIIQMLMPQLQNKNPQMFQTINQAMQNNANPQMILKQMMSNFNPQQMEQVMNQAKQYGVPDNILNQVQNMK